MKHKRNFTNTNPPLAGEIEEGQLAIGMVDGRLFTKDHLGNVIPVGGDVYAVDTIAVLASTPKHNIVAVKAFGTNSNLGGGIFVYDPSIPHGDHDGGNVISPHKSFPMDFYTNKPSTAAWFVPPNDVADGCWVRNNLTEISAVNFGAVGDGVIDNTEIIRGLLLAGEKQKFKKIYFNDGRYKTTEPIVLKSTVYGQSGKNWATGFGHKLVGESKENTIIFKDNNSKTTGKTVPAYASLPEITDPDTVFWLDWGGGTGGKEFHNLTIMNNSTDVDNFVLIGRNIVSRYKDLIIISKYGSGIYLWDAFLNRMEDIVMQTAKRALYVLGGTSSFITNVYARIHIDNATVADPFYLDLAYSNVKVYSDRATGTVFRLGGSITAQLGTESPLADYVVASLGGSAKIDHLYVYGEGGKFPKILTAESLTSHLTVDMIKLYNATDLVEDIEIIASKSAADSSIYDVGDVYFPENKMNGHKITFNLAASAYYHAHSKIGGQRRKARSGEPFIGLTANEKFSTGKPKAIYMDNVTPTQTSERSRIYTLRFNKGDLLLANEPKDMNILGWVVKDIDESKEYISGLKTGAVPLIVSGPTAERPDYSGLPLEVREGLVGSQFFDTTLNKPVWMSSTDGTTWVEI